MAALLEEDALDRALLNDLLQRYDLHLPEQRKPTACPTRSSRNFSGKRELRAARHNMTLPEWVRQVVQLQRIALSAIRRRREPGELEYVWPLDEGR